MELPNRWARVEASIKMRRNEMKKKSCLHIAKQYVVVLSISILISNEHGQIEHNCALKRRKRKRNKFECEWAVCSSHKLINYDCFLQHNMYCVWLQWLLPLFVPSKDFLVPLCDKYKRDEYASHVPNQSIISKWSKSNNLPFNPLILTAHRERKAEREKELERENTYESRWISTV